MICNPRKLYRNPVSPLCRFQKKWHISSSLAFIYHLYSNRDNIPPSPIESLSPHCANFRRKQHTPPYLAIIFSLYSNHDIISSLLRPSNSSALLFLLINDYFELCQTILLSSLPLSSLYFSCYVIKQTSQAHSSMKSNAHLLIFCKRKLKLYQLNEYKEVIILTVQFGTYIQNSILVPHKQPHYKANNNIGMSKFLDGST